MKTFCRDGIMLESDRSHQHPTEGTWGETEMSYYLNILVMDAQLELMEQFELAKSDQVY
jgi:hypothetical protein